jgi:hypothetical protein
LSHKNSAFVFAVLAFGIAFGTSAQAAKICTNATATGTYAIWGWGFGILPAATPNGPATPVSEAIVGLETWDGAGHIVGTATVNYNGDIAASVPLTATTSINPDCTGSGVINIAGIPPFAVAFVIDPSGKSFHSIPTSPGIAYVVEGKRQDD